jgi:lambda repressor-like predicted transcriptional regulator
MPRCGTRSAYAAGCRCESCTVANRVYARQLARRAARIRYGIEPPPPPRLVDASEARRHLHWLRTRGIGLRTVAERTGLSRSALQKISNGQRPRAHQATVDAILGVHAASIPAATRVDAAATVARLDELVQLGHTKASLARRLGNHRALQYRHHQVLERTRRKVELLHRVLTGQQVTHGR